MSNEDFDRKVEFIVEQQAQFASQIGQLEDLLGRFAKATSDRFQLNDRRFDEIDERIKILIDSQIRNEENIRKTEENIKKTQENVKKTDETLRNLITVVDRYFLGGRNDNVSG